MDYGLDHNNNHDKSGKRTNIIYIFEQCENKNANANKKIAIKKNSRFNVFRFVTKKKKGLMSGAGTMNQHNKKKEKGVTTE